MRPISQICALLSLLPFSFCSSHKVILPKWQSVLSDLSWNNGTAYLVQKWKVHSKDQQVNFTTESGPSDLVTDLFRAGIIDDPYFDRNFLTQQSIWMGEESPHRDKEQLRQRTRTWIYSADIMKSNLPESSSYILVLEGIKMGAYLSINDGPPLSINFTSQFLRYIVPLPVSVRSLALTWDPSISTDGRFMACSGGWDWAPYTRTVDERGSRTFTFGPVLPIYILPVRDIYIHTVVPLVRPRSISGLVGNFTVDVQIHLTAVKRPAETYHVLVNSEWDNQTLRVPLDVFKLSTQRNFIISLQLNASSVSLWWPNGIGRQPLFRLGIAIEQNGEVPTAWIEKRIGFRQVALITANDTRSFIPDDREGSGRNGMSFEINGKLIYAKGANVVPMDQLEGRWSSEGHRRMVESAAAANMNMLRVWGGGATLPSAFYEACDEKGILLYHDLMFVGEQNHGALRTKTIENEIKHFVQTLVAHPSIALWSGCNECTYGGADMSIYASFVMGTVANIDDTRPIWPSSPSPYGWKSGVRMKDGLPNGMPLCIRNHSMHVLESHGPYQRGVSFTNPGVNGIEAYNTYETHIPPVFPASRSTSRYERNTFVSEFGASVFSSFESMSAYLKPCDWSIHGGGKPDSCTNFVGNENRCTGNNAMAERNYPCDSRIQSFFGNLSIGEVGATPFRRELNLCILSQSLWMKGQIEIMRSQNSMGTLIWQLNENWPTGGWGLLEYGPTRGVKQQIVGGRWKPLMYLVRDILFRDVIVACGKGGHCYAKNDGHVDVKMEVRFQAWNLDKTVFQNEYVRTIELDAGPAYFHRFRIPSSLLAESDVLLLNYQDVETVYLWKVPYQLPRFQGHIDIQFLELNGSGVHIRVESDYMALYVVLSTMAEGYFLHNAFVLRPRISKVIYFLPLTENEEIDVDLFQQTFRLETLCDNCGLDRIYPSLDRDSRHE